jgi:hypothetical protein
LGIQPGVGVTTADSVEAPIREIADTRELLELLELDDVYFLKLAVERTDNSADPDLEHGPRLEHELYLRHTDTSISVRMLTKVEAKDAVYSVDIVTDYEAETAFEAPEDIRRDFIERVAVMAAWPYLRVAVSDLCARMRTEQITLGLFRPGDIRLGDPTRPD